MAISKKKKNAPFGIIDKFWSSFYQKLGSNPSYWSESPESLTGMSGLFSYFTSGLFPWGFWPKFVEAKKATRLTEQWD